MPDLPFPISLRARVVVVLAGLLVVLGTVNKQILEKEELLRHGAVVLLQLAPVDPRSLLQGDYMALRYALAVDVTAAASAAQVDDGRVVIELDELGVATFVAIYSNQPLGQGQHLLRFRKRGETVRLASDAYFFEEGQGFAYSGARYGELRVAANGDAVLTGLRDESVQRLGPR
ncbi:MAG: GDYXXLXY domain-containing protein [Gammaproteobacteria bacterium]|nr:GDYXXLXY domain-containing protein [Gammaproteobacteria bacterium]MDH4255236.1 GDYXXLXY domain-containing protein [Gammaproteobacteria bacterium]MDH5310047.1 GDYXXLXY domain-containing protein [Gammaproteobacteria bacterium]